MSSKLNLLIFLNCLVAILGQLYHVFVFIFFGTIRQVENKFIIEKCQKKIFQFLLMLVVLQNSLDIYKIMSLVMVLFCWIIHWLVIKRSKGLIGEENRNVKEHARLLILFILLILFDFGLTYIFWQMFRKEGNQMSDIYIMLGFECIRLWLKAIEDNFKYHVSLLELYFQEQWLEKKFVFNCVSLFFDLADFAANVRVFLFIVARGALPIYLLGEIVDNLTRLASNILQLYKWRQFITKLRKLKDVVGHDPENPEEATEGMEEIQCCICLHTIRRGKELNCSHKFHMSCLRSWLIEKSECPTCRQAVHFDEPEAQANGEEIQRRRRNVNGQADGNRAPDNQIPAPDLIGQLAEEERKLNQPGPPPPAAKKGKVQGIFGDAVRKPDKRSILEKQIADALQDTPQKLCDIEPSDLIGKNQLIEITQEEDWEDIGEEEEVIDIGDDTSEEKEDTINFPQFKQPLEPVVESDENSLVDIEEVVEEGKSEDDPTDFEDTLRARIQKRFDQKELESQKADLLIIDDKVSDDEVEEFNYDKGAAEQAMGIQREFERLKDLTSKMNSIVEKSLDASTKNSSLIAQILNLDTDIKSPKAEKKEKKSKVKAPHTETLFQQNMGSVPYGLPCLAVTRRTGASSEAVQGTEQINTKLCSIFRAPGDFVEFSENSASSNEYDSSSAEDELDEQDKAYMRLFKRN